MRHRFPTHKLNRNPEKRAKLLTNLRTFLFEHDRIQTTLARAKALLEDVPKVLSICKTGGLGSVTKLVTKPVVAERIMDLVNDRYKNKNPKSCVKLWRAGLRKSDKAPIAIIELPGGMFDMKTAFERYKNQYQRSLTKKTSNIQNNEKIIARPRLF